MTTAFSEPDLCGQRHGPETTLGDGVKAHTMKVHLFAGAIADIGNVAGDSGRVSMTAACQHHGHSINDVVNLRRAALCQKLVQIAADGLKALRQKIQACAESLIRRQLRKVMPPILINQPMNRFLLKQIVEVPEQVDGY